MNTPKRKLIPYFCQLPAVPAEHEKKNIKKNSSCQSNQIIYLNSHSQLNSKTSRQFRGLLRHLIDSIIQ